MPMRPGLMGEIEALLGPSLIPSLTVSSAACDIFEAYVFVLMLRAAQLEGATITYENVNGPVTNIVTFRTSPNFIWSTADAYTHAIIQFPGKPLLEVHLGVYVEGNSGVLHEADVSVLFRDEAATCRANRVTSPRCKGVVVAVECKFYASNVKLLLGRAFLGMSMDMSGRSLSFVMNCNAASVEKLITKRKRHCESQIVPSSLIDVNRLTAHFQKTFADFKTTH